MESNKEISWTEKENEAREKILDAVRELPRAVKMMAIMGTAHEVIDSQWDLEHRSGFRKAMAKFIGTSPEDQVGGQ